MSCFFSYSDYISLYPLYATSCGPSIALSSAPALPVLRVSLSLRGYQRKHVVGNICEVTELNLVNVEVVSSHA